eukprot:CAMPEP_0178947182 /NCGR_PEP_ID=MMETSP0789-20121207/4705_1 /TAXON_ID=3005 /ORGANISM="Rhizosolenia setigera, Strain CCMP 1694" /LENGTH=236 /DNA_ID=CAMNT_0020627269 /DNA_START=67 /DNA_END=777 /DNA_ORIENTATION=+
MKSPHRQITTSAFDLLNDDTLLNIHKFLGEQTYATFGSINRKCNQLFRNFNIPKETLRGIIPVSMLKETCNIYSVGPAIAYGLGTYKYRVLFDWVLDELKGDRHERVLGDICATACREGWKDIVEEIFERSDKVIPKNDKAGIFLSIENAAVDGGNLDIMKLLHLNGYGECFNEETFASACETGNLEMVIWLHSVGCPWDNSAFEKTRKGEVFEWLCDNLDPMFRYIMYVDGELIG